MSPTFAPSLVGNVRGGNVLKLQFDEEKMVKLFSLCCRLIILLSLFTIVCLHIRFQDSISKIWNVRDDDNIGKRLCWDCICLFLVIALTHSLPTDRVP